MTATATDGDATHRRGAARRTGRWSSSLRNRVAATVALLVVLALAGASAVLYTSLRSSLSRQRDGSLIEAVTDAPALLKALRQDALTSAGAASPAEAQKRARREGGTDPATRGGAGPTTPGPAAPPTRAASGIAASSTAGAAMLGSTTVLVIANPKAPGAGSGFLPVSARDLQVLGGTSGPYLTDAVAAGRPWRVYTTRLPGDPTALVRAAVPTGALDSTLAGLLALLAGITVGGTLLAALAGRLLAGRVLRPVARLTRTVETVARTGDLTVPVRADGQDEIASLARSFATMMAGLDDSVTRQRQLVADASHELRTPLTSLTTNLDLLAEAGPPYDDQAPTMIDEARRQVGELTALVGDLIELARYGRAATHVEDVRLDLVALDVVRRSRARAVDLTIRADCSPALARADPDAVERAIGNLVDNAIKWSPAGGRVLVRVTASGIISVTDEGPGIAPEDLPHVFDRFYRAPGARSLPGSGLGLAIVERVAAGHGGSVSARTLERGTLMEMRLPTIPDPSGPGAAR